MKLLMACDDYVYCHNGKYYAASQEKADFYTRYLRVFDKLRLVTRCKEERELKKERILLDSNIEFVPIPFFQGPIQYAKKYFEVNKVLHNIVQGCDAAVLRLPSTVANQVAKRVKCAKIPYATEIVYDAYDGYQNAKDFVSKLLWRIIDLQMRETCYHADGVSCVTEYYLQKRYFSKKSDAFFSHYSSLALSKSFYGTKRSYPQKKILTIAHVTNQVVYNGRKGHIEILKALKLLKKKGIIINVQFAGEDYFGGIAKLKKLAQELDVDRQIDFLGYLNREELSDFLNRSDLYVMPTRAEGLPRVIIEAMAKGLPCISTNVSGNGELINAEYLIEYEDVQGLANKIEKLVTARDAYEQASEENFNNSLKYEASILEKRRDLFYSKLREVKKPIQKHVETGLSDISIKRNGFRNI